MRPLAALGAAVIGTGFIGTVHVEALRRIGVDVRGVLGSTPDRGRERAGALGVRAAYPTLADLLADDTVDAVHVTSPNDLHVEQSLAILAAGKHVICEKPLAMTAADSARLVEAAAADDAGQRDQLQHPLLPAQPARPRARDRRRPGRRPAGHRALLPGLAAPRHRLELAARARPRRRAPRGRRHRLALARSADVHHGPARRGRHGRPVHVHRHAARADRPRRDVLDRALERYRRPRDLDRGRGDDPAPVRRRRPRRGDRLARSARAGRTRCSTRSTAPSPPGPGIRSSPTRAGSAIATRQTRSSSATRRCSARPVVPRRPCPGGHVEGFFDTFCAHFRAVYADVAAGAASSSPGYPTFADGHDEMVVGDAIAQSAREGRWVTVDRSAASMPLTVPSAARR